MHQSFWRSGILIKTCHYKKQHLLTGQYLRLSLRKKNERNEKYKKNNINKYRYDVNNLTWWGNISVDANILFDAKASVFTKTLRY